MNPAIFNQPFVQIALPLLLGMFLTAWAAITTNNKRFEDMNKRFDDLSREMNRRFEDMSREMNRRFDEVLKRLDSIDSILRNHENRITRIEERSSLVKIG